MKWVLVSTSGWALILCLLAAVSPVMPWRSLWETHYPALSVVRDVPNPIETVQEFPADRLLKSGYGGWEGPVINIVAGLGFFFVLATSPIRPVPWWRTLGIIVVALGVTVVVLFYGDRWWRGRDFPIHEWGALLAILSSAGLLLIAAMEIRQLIERRIVSRSQEKSRATANPR